jgi:hypothetical protein
MNFKNSIDLLASFKINEEENKNAATKKSLNQFYNLIHYIKDSPKQLKRPGI